MEINKKVLNEIKKRTRRKINGDNLFVIFKLKMKEHTNTKINNP